MHGAPIGLGEKPKSIKRGRAPMTLQQVNDELDFEMRALAQTSPRAPAKQISAPKSGSDGTVSGESPTANSTEVIHAT
jgi:hypothetical protein